jgi:hypothetical protein
MNKTLIFLYFILVTIAKAELFIIDNQILKIPAPEGFVIVTPQMRTTYRFNLYLATTDAELLACYISKADAEVAIQGNIPKMERIFYILVKNKLKKQTINPQDFDNLAITINKKIDQNMYLIDEDPTDLTNKISKAVSDDFNINISLKFLKQVALKIHYKTINTFAYSVYNKYKITEKNNEEDVLEAKTATTINVAGKVLDLICEAPAKDLQWSQNSSIAWSQMILKNNVCKLQKTTLNNITDWFYSVHQGFITYNISKLTVTLLFIVIATPSLNFIARYFSN